MGKRSRTDPLAGTFQNLAKRHERISPSAKKNILCRWLAVHVTILLIWPHMAWAQEKTVNLYSWGDYFDPTVLDDFTKETGIKIAYDTYPASDALETRLSLGKSGYDVVVVPAPVLQKEIVAKRLQRLDKSKLLAAKALWPEIMAYLNSFDPGNLYAVNYMWFTLGFTFNDEVMQARHEDAALASWDVIFKPDILKKFADCGVEVQDSSNELFAAALRYLRLDPRTQSLVDLKRAAELLYGLRRNVKRFRPAGDLSNLASGDACLTLGWSSDAAEARKQAHEANSGVTIGYASPKSGALILLDNLAIPIDAPHLDAAYALIDYLLRPDIAARDTKATHYANSIPASKAFLPLEILNDRSIYPDAATMKTFFTAGAYNPQSQAFITREWMRVKTGK